MKTSNRDVRRAVGVAPLELARRLADQLAEPAAERAQAGEADRVADLGDGEVGGAEQVLRALDAAFGHVRRGRLPYVARNSRWKWYLLMPAIAASVPRSSDSA